jgi:hypothetical protein
MPGGNIMHEQRQFPYFQLDYPTPKRVSREWRFTAKDVFIISGIALILSGLMGLGAVMLVEITEWLLRWL